MRFNVILHDLDKKRCETLSSGNSDSYGVVEAENEDEAVKKLGLTASEDGNVDCQYKHRLFSEFGIQFQVTSSETTLAVLYSAEDLTEIIKAVMEYRNELYGMYS